MKDKIYNGILLGILVVVLIGIIMMRNEKKRLVDENRALKVELAHAQIPLQRDTIRDSIPVAKLKVITVDRTDYKQQIADKKLISDLKLKLSEIEAENRLLLATRDTVTLKPSLYEDSVMTYRDRWVNFRYELTSRKLGYQVWDSLVTHISRIPKHRFLWFRWGTKGYQLTHTNFNPNAEIKYSSFIKVE